jgi:hypothetical protein
MPQEVFTIFEVTDIYIKKDSEGKIIVEEGKKWKETIKGFGPNVVRLLKPGHPRYSHYVLKGWEIDGKFKKVMTR